MVTPLYLASLLIERGNILEQPWLKREVTSIRLGNLVYPVYGSNIIAAFVFVGSGLLILGLAFTGKLGMTVDDSHVAAMIQGVAEKVTGVTQSIPFVNVAFGIILVGGLYWFVRRAMLDKGDNSNDDESGPDCCND